MSGRRCWLCGEKVAAGAKWCTNHRKPVRLVIGRYIVEREIGGGAFGTVYECHDPEIDRQVAVKVLKEADDIDMGAFQAELAGARLLQGHSNVVTVYDVLSEDKAIVMEYVGGGTLAEKMAQDSEWVKANFVRIMKQVCEALRAAHAEGIIHRDVKPANILITEDGNIKLSDFGVCAVLDGTRGYASTCAGSPAYMDRAVLAQDQYGCEVDVHSLGCVMYEIWAGRLPWMANGGSTAWLIVKNSELPEPLPAEAGEELNDLVMGMLALSKGRIKNISTVRQQLYGLDPVWFANARGLDELQLKAGAVFGQANADKSLLYVLSQYLISLSEVANGMIADDSSKLKERLLPKQFMWLCAVVSAANVTVGELVDLKFGEGRCPYCHAKECSCGNGVGESHVKRNRELLKSVKAASRGKHVREWGFEECRGMFRQLYGKANAGREIDEVASRAYAEVAEAIDASLHLKPEDGEDSMYAFHLELADLVAWFFALLNLQDPSYDFVKAFNGLLGDGCYVCGRKPCKCKEPEGIHAWRDVLDRTR